MGKSHSKAWPLCATPTSWQKAGLHPRPATEGCEGRMVYSSVLGLSNRPPLIWCTTLGKWGFLAAGPGQGCPICREDICTIVAPEDHNLWRLVLPCRFRRNPYVKLLAGKGPGATGPWAAKPARVALLAKGHPTAVYSALIWLDFDQWLSPTCDVDWGKLRDRAEGAGSPRWIDPPFPAISEPTLHTAREEGCIDVWTEFPRLSPMLTLRRRADGTESAHDSRRRVAHAAVVQQEVGSELNEHAPKLEVAEYKSLMDWLALESWVPLLARPFSREASMMVLEWHLVIHCCGAKLDSWLPKEEREEDLLDRRVRHLGEFRQAYGEIWEKTLELCRANDAATLKELSAWRQHAWQRPRTGRGVCGSRVCLQDEFGMCCTACTAAKKVREVDRVWGRYDPRRVDSRASDDPSAPTDWEDHFYLERYIREKYAPREYHPQDKQARIHEELGRRMEIGGVRIDCGC